MAEKKAKVVTYTALIGFSAGAKNVYKVGQTGIELEARLAKQLVAMKRIALDGSDEATEVVERLKARNERAEKARKAAEAAGRLPGAK